MTFFKTISGAAIAVVLAAPAVAQDTGTVEARQGQFKLYGHNLAVVGGMAQGRMDYDAAMAQTAADNLFHLTRHDQSRLWPEGTDSSMMMETRAKAEIWENLDDFTAKFVAMQDATVALQGAAGNGLDALRPAVGTLGASCGACHEAYREES